MTIDLMAANSKLQFTILRGHSLPVVSLLELSDVDSNLNLENQRFIVSGSEDGTCRVWNLETQRVVKAVKFKKGFMNDEEDVTVTSIVRHPKSKMCYITVSTNLYGFDLSESESSMIITEPSRMVLSVSEEELNQVTMNSKGTQIVLTGDSGDVVFASESNEGPKGFQTLSAHENICTFALYHPLKPVLYSGGMDYNFCTFTTNPPKLNSTINLTAVLPSCESSQQGINPPFILCGDIMTFGTKRNNGTILALGLGNGGICVLKQPKETGWVKKISKMDQESSNDYRTLGIVIPEFDGIELINPHNYFVSTVQFVSTPTRRFLVSGSSDGSICIWDLTHFTTPPTKSPQLLQKFETPYKINKLIAIYSPFLNANSVVANDASDSLNLTDQMEQLRIENDKVMLKIIVAGVLKDEKFTQKLRAGDMIVYEVIV
ncbi:WD40-repeat-containing domain protein [Paraphysoderma sedebokerense]|nr:WD40-repeat-containing domain protein [Paraphysoderma sedebokerense]